MEKWEMVYTGVLTGLCSNPLVIQEQMTNDDISEMAKNITHAAIIKMEALKKQLQEANRI